MMARLSVLLIEACRLAVSGDAVLGAIDLADRSRLGRDDPSDVPISMSSTN